jgi:hypothetical protein
MVDCAYCESFNYCGGTNYCSYFENVITTKISETSVIIEYPIIHTNIYETSPNWCK